MFPTDCTRSAYTGEAKLTNDRCGGGEKGGAHILVMALLALGMIAVITVVSFNAAVQYAGKSKLKTAIDAAAHAAALDMDKTAASYGHAQWDSAAGIARFYDYLQKNLHLDAENRPLPGSMLSAPPIVHMLTSIASSSYPYDYSVSVTVHAGTPQETVRTVRTRLYGPSVVAIVEISVPMHGEGADEPIVLSSAASIRPRY